MFLKSKIVPQLDQSQPLFQQNTAVVHQIDEIPQGALVMTKDKKNKIKKSHCAVSLVLGELFSLTALFNIVI